MKDHPGKHITVLLVLGRQLVGNGKREINWMLDIILKNLIHFSERER